VQKHRTIFAELVKASGGDFTSLAVRPTAGAEPDWRLDLISLGEWVRQLPKPVAILCWNASSAREIIFACHETGLPVPEEVAVLSQADDEVLCETSLVPISGISVSGHGIGHRAAEVLDDLMEGRQAASAPDLIAPLGVVTRQSTETLALHDPILVKALSFLRRHNRHVVHVEQIARHVGVSRRVLERRFGDLLKRSPADEIRRVHLERARKLLLDTDLPMSRVAELSGFGSQAYFSELFRRHTGFKPVEYRKKHSIRLKGFR
jgi:LacI family transcriptional regulator